MFFFSGVIFPIDNLPKFVKPITEIIPLTHSVRLVRAICRKTEFSKILLWDISYIILFIVLIGFLAIKRLKKIMIK